MGVGGVERELQRGCEFEDFGAGSCEFVAKRFVLRLGCGEVGGVMKAKIAPVRDAFRLAPSRGAGRAYQHALERPDHGVAVNGYGGFGRFWQELSFARGIGVTEMILRQSWC